MVIVATGRARRDLSPHPRGASLGSDRPTLAMTSREGVVLLVEGAFQGALAD